MSRRWLTLPLCAIALALLTATPVAAAKPESFDFLTVTGLDTAAQRGQCCLRNHHVPFRQASPLVTERR